MGKTYEIEEYYVIRSKGGEEELRDAYSPQSTPNAREFALLAFFEKALSFGATPENYEIAVLDPEEEDALRVFEATRLYPGEAGYIVQAEYGKLEGRKSFQIAALSVRLYAFAQKTEIARIAVDFAEEVVLTFEVKFRGYRQTTQKLVEETSSRIDPFAPIPA